MSGLPDFLVVGTQRGGTSSLYWHLIRHPLIAQASRKKVHYFDFHYERGIDWYLSDFPEEKPDVLVEQQQRVVADRFVVTVVSAAFLLATDRALGRIHVG